MKWVLASHVIFVICWFAGLFYLPRLFAYHADAQDAISIARFKIMERRLFWGIMTPAGLLATLFGFWYLYANLAQYEQALWMHIKLIFVFGLWIFHAYCWRQLQHFQHDRQRHSSIFYRWINEIPTVVLLVVVIMAVVQPHF